MEPMTLWRDFITHLHTGCLPVSMIRPYPSLENLLEPLQSGLNNHLRAPLLAAFTKGIDPECFVVGNQMHFILPLGSSDEVENFCFSFLVEDDHWYFQHVENIFIRLDQLGTPPISMFPDLPEDKKAWARDEIQVSAMVRLYNILAAEKGKEFAANSFRDGTGYFIGARAWIPFLPPAKAFILYVCWDLANLHNNPITLASMDETSAVIQGNLRYFTLYKRAAHLAQQISVDSYYQLFETIWHDRAVCAGWDVRIRREGEQVTFFFSRRLE